MISFIICNLNNAPYIEKCINSILQINNLSYEIVIIDYFSCDLSVNIIDKKFTKQNNFKKICLKSNVGTFNARKIGFENSMGEYICFVDSDDFLSDSFFNKCIVKYSIKKNYDIIFSQIYLKQSENFYEISQDLIWNPPKNNITLDKILSNFLDGYCGPPGQCCKLLKRELVQKTYEKIKIKKILSFAEDQLFMLVYLNFIKSYLSLKIGSYFYRINHNSVTHKLLCVNIQSSYWYLKQLQYIKRILKKIKFETKNKKKIKCWIKSQHFSIYKKLNYNNLFFQMLFSKNFLFLIRRGVLLNFFAW